MADLRPIRLSPRLSSGPGIYRSKLDGITSTEDMREVDRFHEEWAALKGRLTLKGGLSLAVQSDAVEGAHFWTR